jgi:hypothetical protein
MVPLLTILMLTLNMKKAIVFITLFQLLCGINFTQTFEKFERTLEDDIVYCAVAINSEEVVFALNYGDYNSSDYNAKLFRINSQNGDLVDSCNVEFYFSDYKLNQISDIFLINPNTIIIIGQCENINSNDKQIFIAQYTENLELIYGSIVGDELTDEWYFDVIYSSDSLFVFTGMEQSGILFLEERDIYGTLIRRNTYQPGGTLASTLVEIPFINKYHLFQYWDTNHSFIIIDKDSLSLDTIIQYPLGFLPRNAISGLDSSYYYVAGRQYDLYPGTLGDFLSFLKVSSNGQIIEQNDYEIDEQITYYTTKSFSYNSNAIFFGGTYPCTWDPPMFFYPEQRWILLYKLTHSGEILWQSFYKGEVHYMTYKVLATNDGGALIFSTKYDWNDPIPNQRDVHILKIDSTGYYDPLTGTDEERTQMNKQILVYPNPADNEVNFVLGLYSNLQLSIYNSTGERKLLQSLPSSQTIDVSGLPAGIYVYLLTGQNGFKESGKLIIK